MAGELNVPAQKVFLEENGCNAGGCFACNVIILSPVGVNQIHWYRRERFWVHFWAGSSAVSLVVKRSDYRCGRSWA